MEKVPLGKFKFAPAERILKVATTGAGGDGRKRNLKTVPEWWYNEKVCGMTKAKFWWYSNLLCFVFHLGLAAITVVMSTANGRSFATPTLTVYVTNLTWRANSTDALVPTFQKADTPLYLTTMTMMFFILSALAHGLIVIFNFPQAFAANNKAMRTVGCTGWYYVWLHQCRQPLRWLEYSVSASLMSITISVASGVTHTYMLTFIFVLMAMTMYCGYVTELLSPPEDAGDDDVRPTQWVVSSGNPDLPPSFIPAFIQRLGPHLIGYVPYLAVWVVLGHSFFFNVGDGEQGPPAFVYIIVVGQFVVFSSFGITQLVNQIDPNGPSWYCWGEFSYLVLSLFSKGLLGLTLVANVFLFDSFQEAVVDAQMSS